MENFSPNQNFKYFMYWVTERMNIFWKRYMNQQAPWTDDPILTGHKFTNVYRVLDRSSQYMLSNVISDESKYSSEDMAWRILLYKHFNIPQTWEALTKEFGDITLEVDPNKIVDFLHHYSLKNIVYSNAYMITASFMRSEAIKSKYGLKPGMPKFKSYLRLYWKGFIEEGVLIDILDSKTMEQGFNNFKRVVGIADFLAYQFVQDFNYTNIVDWDDNSFCAAGAGTQRGVNRVFDIKGKPDYQEIVKWVHNNFDQLIEDYGFKFIGLPDHKPRVPDISNCFCEVDKYMRGAGIKATGIEEGRIKQKFTEPKENINYVFPKKWKIKNLG